MIFGIAFGIVVVAPSSFLILLLLLFIDLLEKKMSCRIRFRATARHRSESKVGVQGVRTLPWVDFVPLLQYVIIFVFGSAFFSFGYPSYAAPLPEEKKTLNLALH